MSGRQASVFERLMRHTEVTPTCWLWRGALTRGYGQLRVEDQMKYAHRVSYELAHGPIPEGLQLDHLCRVPNCIRPSHLEPVTQQVNIERGDAGKRNISKTHCPQGHEYTEANTGRTTTGARYCRACKMEKSRAWRARKAQANRLLPDGAKVWR
jgi:hypothetical protein